MQSFTKYGKTEDRDGRKFTKLKALLEEWKRLCSRFRDIEFEALRIYIPGEQSCKYFNM